MEMHSPSSELNTYLENKKELSIRELVNNEPLNQALRYCITLVGIKKEYIPSQEQFMVLVDFLRNRQGNYTAGEIKHAFMLAVEGKLEVKVVTYQSFDSVFVSDILNSYKDYITKKGYHYKINQEENKEISEEEKLKILNDDALRVAAEYERILKGFTNQIRDPYGVVYNHLVRLGIISPTKDERKQVFEFCKNKMQCEKITDSNDRKCFTEFKEGVSDKHNKYYVKCKLKSMSYISENFIKKCLSEKRALHEQIRMIVE